MSSLTASKKVDEEWLGAAMTDDAVVAELLVRLKQTRAKAVQLLATPPGWGLRLPRSRPSLSTSRCDVFSGSRRKGASDPSRRSPTTPLTWSCGSGSGSGGGSPSATADGFEESSSGRRYSSVGRSKGIGANETASTISRRSRKKEISTSRDTCIEQRGTNGRLKKMKLDPNLYDEPQKAGSRLQRQHRSSTLPTCADQLQSDHRSVIEEAGSSRDNSFLLPDLNISPCEDEDDSGSYTLYGM